MIRKLSIFTVAALAIFAVACKPQPQGESAPPAATQEAAAPAMPTTTGVTDTEIKIGSWAPLTGPAASYAIVAKAQQAYINSINDAGGIHGRMLKLELRDDAYQPAKTVAAVKELVEKEQVFAFAAGIGTATGMAVKDYLDENQKVWVGPATGSSVWADPPSKYRFAVYPTYGTEATLLVEYAAKNFKKKKLAVFYQNDAFGEEGLKAVRATAARLGLEVLEEVSHEMTDTDLSSQALKVKSSGADTVVIWSTPKHAAMFVKSAAKIKYKPQYFTTSTLTDPVMFQLAGDAWNKVISADWMPLPTDETEGVAEFKAAMEKYAPGIPLGNFTMVAFVLTEPLIEGLRRAGRDLTTEKLVDAMDSLDKWSGKYAHEVSFGPGKRQGTDQVFFVQAQDGKLVRLTDWRSTMAAGDEAAEAAPAAE
ncbi:ABC transporter substrate-binding protein [bacterium]|nr:ABC transporter substrate-binding protein [bacterium]